MLLKSGLRMFKKELNNHFRMLREGNYFSDYLISIVITTYKRPIPLKRAVESALNQVTNSPFNIIIIDGDPIENYLINEILDNHSEITYYRTTKQIDMFSMINYSFNSSNSNYICILHDDDELLTNYIEHMSLLLNSIDDFSCILNYPLEFDTKNSKSIINIYHLIKKHIQLGVKPKQIGGARFLLDNPAVSSGTFFNRQLFDSVHAFDNFYWPSSDFELYSRLAIDHKVILTPVRCSKYNWDVNLSLKLEIISKTICMDYKIRHKNINSTKNLNFKFFFHFINYLILVNSISKLPNLDLIKNSNYEIFQKFNRLSIFKIVLLKLIYILLKMYLILPIYFYKTDKLSRN